MKHIRQPAVPTIFVATATQWMQGRSHRLRLDAINVYMTLRYPPPFFAERANMAVSHPEAAALADTFLKLPGGAKQ